MKVTLNTNNYNRYQNNTMQQRPAFKGVYDSATDKLAHGLGKLANKDKTIKFIDWMANKGVVSSLAVASSVVITGFYMYNTAKSKKIEEDQKKPLMLNMALVTALASITGLLIDGAAKKKMDQFEKYFETKTKNVLDAKTADICKKGIKPAATLLIFTTVYRYLSPVIATPIANKISNLLMNKNNNTTKKA